MTRNYRKAHDNYHKAHDTKLPRNTREQNELTRKKTTKRTTIQKTNEEKQRGKISMTVTR